MKYPLAAAVTSLLIITGSVLAQEHARQRVEVSVTVIQATVENRDKPYYEPSIRHLSDTLANLRYDTYHLMHAKKATIPFGAENRVPLDHKRYTLCLTPLTKERDGRIRITTRIEEKRSGEDKDRPPINALKATSIVVPGDKLLFHGLDLDRGKMVLILKLREH